MASQPPSQVGEKGAGTNRATGGRSNKSAHVSLNYSFAAPPPLPDFRTLNSALSAEVLCSYRPTALELQTLTTLPTNFSELGPPVDLIDPVSAYPWTPNRENRTLHPADAALLVDLVPGVSHMLNSSDASRPSSDPEPQVVAVHSPAAVNRCWDETRLSEFRHPTKPDLQPVRVLRLVPHPKFSVRAMDQQKLVQASAHQVNLGSDKMTDGVKTSNISSEDGESIKPENDAALSSDGRVMTSVGDVAVPRVILKCVEHVSSRLKHYALYNRPGGEVQSLEKVTFNHNRDYIVRIPEDAFQSTNLLLHFPKDTANDRVYFTPLHGPKLLFSKSGAAPDQLAHHSIDLGFRVPTSVERANRVSKFEALMGVDSEGKSAVQYELALKPDSSIQEHRLTDDIRSDDERTRSDDERTRSADRVADDQNEFNELDEAEEEDAEEKD